MYLNSWGIRLGIIGAALVLLLFYLLWGGELFPGTKPGILIEFGSDPDEFVGLPVEIDGKIVGKLERFGQATRTGFTTTKGPHIVRVVSPNIPCEPLKIDNLLPGMKRMLLLEYDEVSDGSGRMKQVLLLRE